MCAVCVGVQKESERERLDSIKFNWRTVSVSCYCPIGFNGEMLHRIATRNKNQKQSFSAAPSSIVDVSENVFLMRIEIDKNTGSDFFPPAAFQACAYIYFSSRPLFARSFHVCGDEEQNLKASSSSPVSWREEGKNL